MLVRYNNFYETILLGSLTLAGGCTEWIVIGRTGGWCSQIKSKRGPSHHRVGPSLTPVGPACEVMLAKDLSKYKVYNFIIQISLYIIIKTEKKQNREKK